jgi:hypothetical protein
VLTFEHDDKMKQIVLAILATVVVSSAALAACPPGTTYNCFRLTTAKCPAAADNVEDSGLPGPEFSLAE